MVWGGGKERDFPSSLPRIWTHQNTELWGLVPHSFSLQASSQAMPRSPPPPPPPLAFHPQAAALLLPRENPSLWRAEGIQ